MKEKIRIGCGAGFSGDRLEPAVVLAQKGELDYLVLECLAERTIALAQKRKLQDQMKGYDPLLELRDGSAIISKVEGTGGVVNLQTAKEQLLYEVINPHEYYIPDVIADFTTVKLKEIGQNRVQVTGGTGKKKPESYKVSVGYKAFYLGEGEISYAGVSAFERAKLAGQIIEKRLKNQFEDFKNRLY
jgi:hypothetical protein